MKPFYIFLLSVFTIGFSNADVPQTQREALVDLYNSTNGNQWRNSWDLNTNVSSWYGVF